MNKQSQQGASLLIVLVILMVLLLGALSMARLTETSTSISGNIAFKDSSIQASEIGVSEAFARLRTVTDLEQDLDGWYFASIKGDDSTGLPLNVDYSKVAQVSSGSFTVSYIVERMCTGTTPILDLNAQCVIKKLPTTGSAKAGMEALETAAAKEYRITVLVTGPKNTKTYVQTMVVR